MSKSPINTIISEVLGDHQHGAEHLNRRLAEAVFLQLDNNLSQNEWINWCRRVLGQLQVAHPDLVALHNFFLALIEILDSATPEFRKEIEVYLTEQREKTKFAVEQAVSVLGGKYQQFVTLSHSSLVLQTLVDLNRERPIIVSYLESSPLFESYQAIAKLKRAGIKTSIVADNSVAYILDEADAVLLGMDQIDNCSFVNRAGSLASCLIAKHLQKPVFLIGTTNKLVHRCKVSSAVQLASPPCKGAELGYDKEQIPLRNVPYEYSLLEIIPLSFVSQIILDSGIFDPKVWLKNCT